MSVTFANVLMKNCCIPKQHTSYMFCKKTSGRHFNPP